MIACRTLMVLRTVLVVLFLAAGTGALGGQLAGPYTDPSYLTSLWFGVHSHWLQPWRAYLETVPARVFLQGIGINFNVEPSQADLVAQMLAKCGIRCARIEIGWGNLNYDDETQINNADRFRALLLACRRHGLRPLVLLNAHQGVPCPARLFQRRVLAEAPAGARQVQLDKTDDLVPGRSGLANLSGYWAAEAIITEIAGNTVTLSKPLPKPLPAGTQVPMATLKYRPFAAPGSPECEETVAGWLRYVATVTRFVTEVLETGQAEDRGFDLEIWNELSFGSRFLYLNHYYDPPVGKWDDHAIFEALVKATAEYMEAHPSDFAGVRVNDGFGNTIPWPASSREPARICAIGKHPYAGRRNYPQDEYKGVALNALGREDNYVPTYSACFPEYFATALQTETLIRDMAPLETEIYGVKHGRYARPGAPCAVWITEVGYSPSEDGVSDWAEAQALKAKTTARYLAFYLNKGVDKLCFYAAAGGDLNLGLVQDNFLTYAKEKADYPAEDEPYLSSSLQVVSRLVDKMSAGLDPDLEDTRDLVVEAIEDTHDHYQFPGDGTPEHPPLYDREVFAFLPFQVNARRLVIAYYVMTRDVKRPLAPEAFTVTVAGLQARHARFSAYDPTTDQPVPVRVVEATERHIKLDLATTDYPRLLIVDEE